MSTAAKGSGTPERTARASAAKLAFARGPYVSGRRSDVTRSPVASASSASASSASRLRRRVVVVRVGRIAFAKRASRQRRLAVDLDRAREHEVRDAGVRRRARQAHGDVDVHPADRRARGFPARLRLVHARGEVNDVRGAVQQLGEPAVVDGFQVPGGNELRARRGSGVERAHESAHRAAPGRQRRARGAPDESSGAGDDDRRGTRHQNHFQPCRR